VRPSRLLLLGIAGICVAAAAFCYSLPSPCGNDVIDEVRSPDGRYRIVIFQRDCGATTGFSTQLSLLKADEELPNESGNVFIADTQHGIAPSGPRGGPEVHVQWLSGAAVSVTHHPAARVFESEALVEGIHFVYRKQELGSERRQSLPADGGS
jgi:hypothetical protein